MIYRASIVTGGSLAALLIGLQAGPSVAQAPEQVWQASGFEAPESALYDPDAGVIYVSNVAGAPDEKNGQGFISKLSPEGEVQEAKWATGLNAPKGLALVDGNLYVADIDTVVAISTEDGKIHNSWTVQGAKFLNDVTADDQGRVFVSDMMGPAIYVIDGGQVQKWMEGGDLTAPNGLLATPDGLVVASWGDLKEGSFETDTPGHLKLIDYDSKEVSSIGSGEPVGNLDGVEAVGDGSYLVTDWMNGALFRIDAEGQAEQLLDLNQGSADLEYMDQEQLAVIPMMMDGTVTAYRIQ